ncbi:hypothetical protein [Reyranella sp.]|uniref:hypothetical protein n=1 Tax=Reyranella sp. TaxID=1929291 RepID=UPI0026050ED2|nr:hypothetical protein [Reyranella sp.]HQS17239.1 hypothetical protein [Reyranella sp.]HQT13690.1 hypothetical protein [Reyranella sp.]
MTALATAAAAALSVPTASAAAIGGTDYAGPMRLPGILDGYRRQVRPRLPADNPFPTLHPEQSAASLLPVMQAAKPRPALTFTYDMPLEDPRPDYRLVLVSNAATT